jgi:hypothetical protein
MENNESNNSLHSAADLLKVKEPHSYGWLKFVIVCLIFAAMCYLGWHYFLQQEIHVPSQEEILQGYVATEALPAAPEGKDPYNYGLDDSSSVLVEPSGYIFFTGVEKSTGRMNEWYYDLSAPEAGPASFLPRLPSSGMIEFENVAAPSGTFYLTAVSSSSRLLEKGSPLGIHRFNFAQGYADYLSSTRSSLQRGLALSPDRLTLAFSHGNSGVAEADLYLLSNWSSALVDVASNTISAEVSGAIQPKWSPDGSKILFMKTDGLYLYTVATHEQEKVLAIPESGQMLTSSMYDVSPDGKRLIMTIPKKGVIIVNNIVTWEPFTLQEVGRIHEDATEYYWPQFSADGLYYTVQAITGAARSDQRSDPRLEVRPILSRKVTMSLPLGNFDFNRLFTDTWTRTLPQLDAQTANTATSTE